MSAAWSNGVFLGVKGRSNEITVSEASGVWKTVEWSAHVLNRFEVGKDGRTAFERCKGTRAKHLGIEFGEAVLWRKNPQVELWGSCQLLGRMVFVSG